MLWLAAALLGSAGSDAHQLAGAGCAPTGETEPWFFGTWKTNALIAWGTGTGVGVGAGVGGPVPFAAAVTLSSVVNTGRFFPGHWANATGTVGPTGSVAARFDNGSVAEGRLARCRIAAAAPRCCIVWASGARWCVHPSPPPHCAMGGHVGVVCV